jgi:hypothetical protein
MDCLRLPFLLAVVGALLVAACGEGRSSPTSPSSSSTATLAIVGPAVALTGTSVTYSLTVSLPGGGGGNARPTTWSIDNTGVATILSASDGVGELTALGPGAATITAMYHGATVTQPLIVRDASEQTGGANLAISFSPDLPLSSPAPCPGYPLSPPTWSFTETIAETRGIGFKVEMATIALYGENGNQIYLSTDPEDYYFPPNSAFVEESCLSLFGWTSGFYMDGLNGADDLGNQLTFASSRLRLLPSSLSTMSNPLSFLSRGTVTRTRRRLR